jgi:hypothetical protein
MFLLVTITGASGFLASSLLLRLGLTEMWLRYLTAFGVAYLVFLFLLWLWLRTRSEDYLDLPDPSLLSPRSGGSGSSSVSYSGKGGDFSGGGASASFEAPSDSALLGDASSKTVGETLGSAADADVLAIPLVVIFFIGTILCSSIFMVYSAPILFAELLVDGVLSASLYRRLRGLETRHWLETAVRRTVWPFILTAMLVSAFGWGMALYAPQAQTLGEVITHFKQSA